MSVTVPLTLCAPDSRTVVPEAAATQRSRFHAQANGFSTVFLSNASAPRAMRFVPPVTKSS